MKLNEATEKINELELKFTIKEKEQENYILKIETDKKQQTLNFLYIFTIAIIVAALFFFFLYRKNKLLSKLVDEKNQLLEKVNQELFKTLELRTKFISIISHDLKNSFAAFKNLISLLISKFNDLSTDRFKELLLEMKIAANNNQLLLENLLDWSMTKTKTLEPELSLVSTNKVIKECISLFESQASAKFVTLQYSTNENFEIYIDKKMFSSIVRNLLVNAIKYSKMNSIVEIFEKITRLENQNFYQFSVQDFGIGMEQGQIESIFNAEQIFSTIGTLGEKGSGLGLQLCIIFVNLHNGNLQIHSNIHSGTTILVNLPLNYDLYG